MEKFRPRVNKQINSAHRAAHYLRPINLHKRLDLLRRTETLDFLKQYPSCSKHATFETEFYIIFAKRVMYSDLMWMPAKKLRTHPCSGEKW